MTARKRAEAIETARAAQISWDDLRDRRTQRAIWERFTRESLAVPMARRQYKGWFFALGLAAAASFSVLAWFRWSAPVVSPLGLVVSASASSNEQRVAFDQGSQGFLSPDAEVETTSAQPTHYEVAQRKGKVRYDIRHDPQRVFVVRVADVTITVLGTQFSVELRESMVSVRVDRGRVRVFDGQRATELVTGEAIEVRAFYAQAPELAAEPPPQAPEPESLGKRGADAQAPGAKPVTINDLLAQADAARAAGHSAEAANLLRAAIAHHPSAAQASNAEFILARVERSRGRHASAAQAFEQCAALGGTLASEALAEAAASWLSAGDPGRARSAAQRYVRYFPHGPQAEKMHLITE